MRILIASLVVLAISVSYFVYSEIRNRLVKQESLAYVIPDPTPPRVSNSELVYSPSIVEISETIEEKSDMTFITTDESTLGDETDEEWCCSDEEFDYNDFLNYNESEWESKEVYKEKVKSFSERFIDKHGMTPESMDYLEFGRMFRNGEPLSASDGLRFAELVAYFYPSEKNRRSYENMRRVFSEFDFSNATAVYQKN